MGDSDLFAMENCGIDEDVVAVQSLVLARKTDDGVAAIAILVNDGGTTTVGPTVYQPRTYSYVTRPSRPALTARSGTRRPGTPCNTATGGSSNAMDAYTNLAVSVVATAPSPATSGTSLVVTAGHGTRFPTPPFNATVWPTGVLPDPTNAEIVRVTAIATDTLTITRAQEGTTARTILATDLIAATITKQLLDDLVAGGGTRTITVVFGTGVAVDHGGAHRRTSPAPTPGRSRGTRLSTSMPRVTSGSIVIDVWKDTYANFPPTVADTITASAKPTLSSATKSDDTTLTGWTTAVTAGDVFGFRWTARAR